MSWGGGRKEIKSLQKPSVNILFNYESIITGSDGHGPLLVADPGLFDGGANNRAGGS